jgi:hypothetical protein
MLSTKPLTLLAVGALALALAACGSSSDDVKSTLQDYNDAVANKDAGQACGLLSDAAKKTITQGGKKTCEQQLKAGFAILSSKQLDAFKNTEVKNVKVNGDNATATITFPKDSAIPEQTQALVKQGGDWKLQAAGAK